MASIFTYETEPVRVASPWPSASLQPENTDATLRNGQVPRCLAGMEIPPLASLADCKISKLDAEPQEGPIEYKLHLLLRPRRSFSAISTVQKVSGSYLSKSRLSTQTSDLRDRSITSSPALAPSNQSRLNRLQHLTTQLLWRLQQSSPYHSSSKSDLVLPILPEADLALSATKGPRPLIAGLEESLGALYEIGVSDDGTFVGLTPDELEESLNVLRAMAFSLGCSLRVLRMVVVGDCQWEDPPLPKANGQGRLRKEKLWVTEVLVAPHLKSQDTEEDLSTNDSANRNGFDKAIGPADKGQRHESMQLRVSLTGSTTSGKSSLLGTLSTSTLDNGRGKSRLSLLKHRHEIVSGVTSSLAQELIGYHDTVQRNSTDSVTNIVNYASGNVSSWIDIHNLSEPGRLVFVTDSAGHPKFRRTTVRGLTSWAPHWTLCCVAADDDENSAGRIGATASSYDVLGSAGQGIDLSKAHLELCLKLDLPVVVIITKLDLATRNGLRQSLAKVLTTLKAAGRKPAILPNHAIVKADSIPEAITQHDRGAVRKAIESVPFAERHLLAPIVLTSALTGGGIGQVHALLRQLPLGLGTRDFVKTFIPNAAPGPAPSFLFHVDEVFTVAESYKDHASGGAKSGLRFVLSGYLRFGSAEIGDNLLLGPFTFDLASRDSKSSEAHRANSIPSLSKSLPKDMVSYAQYKSDASSGLTNTRQEAQNYAQIPKTWHSVKITNLRYLRLPTRKLSEGQVGTVAISTSENLFLNADPFVRRGMVLTVIATSDEPPAYTRITAVFADPNIYVNPGSSVTIYTASIRAPAKIVDVKMSERDGMARADEVFSFDDNDSDAISNLNGQQTPPASALDQTSPLEEIEITFQFTNSREWVEMGTKLLVTPASGISMLSPPRSGDGDVVVAAAPAGLDGFVGRIVGGSQ